MSRLTRLGALAVLAFVLAGCGNSNETSSDETATTSTPATTVAVTTTEPPTATTAGESAAKGTRACIDHSDVAKGTSSGELESAGLNRTYLVHVPTSYDGSTAMPLVFEFHGYSTSASGHSAYSGLGQLGDEEGFITAIPDGRGDPRRWLFEPDEAAIDITTENPDVAFVVDLVDHLGRQLCVDPDRIYATGFSNGGWMASAVACTLPDVFAAVAPVAGVMDFGDDCTPESPVPMLTHHGTADEFEPFEGGRGDASAFQGLPIDDNPILSLSVPDRTARWAERNGCDPDPTETAISEQVSSVTYDCPAGGAVALYRIEEGGHTWPGRMSPAWLGPVTMDIDANEVMWAFFRDHT